VIDLSRPLATYIQQSGLRRCIRFDKSGDGTGNKTNTASRENRKLIVRLPWKLAMKQSKSTMILQVVAVAVAGVTT
jgi:hypothetical protein